MFKKQRQLDDRPEHCCQPHDARGRVSPVQQFNEPILAALLASCSVKEVMERFRISPRNLARLRARLDL